MIPFPEIDEGLLKNIAEITGGMYFCASNNTDWKIFIIRLTRLEKSKIEVTSYHNAAELFSDWLNAGLILILLEFGLSKTILKTIP